MTQIDFNEYTPREIYTYFMEELRRASMPQLTPAEKEEMMAKNTLRGKRFNIVQGGIEEYRFPGAQALEAMRVMVKNFSAPVALGEQMEFKTMRQPKTEQMEFAMVYDIEQRPVRTADDMLFNILNHQFVRSDGAHPFVKAYEGQMIAQMVRLFSTVEAQKDFLRQPVTYLNNRPILDAAFRDAGDMLGIFDKQKDRVDILMTPYQKQNWGAEPIIFGMIFRATASSIVDALTPKSLAQFHGMRTAYREEYVLPRLFERIQEEVEEQQKILLINGRGVLLKMEDVPSERQKDLEFAQKADAEMGRLIKIQKKLRPFMRMIVREHYKKNTKKVQKSYQVIDKSNGEIPQRDGGYESFRFNGTRLVAGTFKADMPQGVFTFMRPDGSVRLRAGFDQGKLVRILRNDADLQKA